MRSPRPGNLGSDSRPDKTLFAHEGLCALRDGHSAGDREVSSRKTCAVPSMPGCASAVAHLTHTTCDGSQPKAPIRYARTQRWIWMLGAKTNSPSVRLFAKVRWCPKCRDYKRATDLGTPQFWKTKASSFLAAHSCGGNGGRLLVLVLSPM